MSTHRALTRNGPAGRSPVTGLRIQRHRCRSDPDGLDGEKHVDRDPCRTSGVRSRIEQSDQPEEDRDAAPSNGRGREASRQYRRAPEGEAERQEDRRGEQESVLGRREEALATVALWSCGPPIAPDWAQARTPTSPASPAHAGTAGRASLAIPGGTLAWSVGEDVARSGRVSFIVNSGCGRPAGAAAPWKWTCLVEPQHLRRQGGMERGRAVS
jgi:hypothetical protein